jgi:signal transduction histidine kinase/CheY-like chemotaxis protein
VAEPASQLRSEEVPRSFHLKVQRNRLAVMFVMAGAAAVGRFVGELYFEWRPWILLLVLGTLSVIAFSLHYRHAERVAPRERLDLAWLLFDVGLTSGAIYILADQTPLWMLWYMTSAAAAAFSAGRSAAHVVIGASCAAYLGTLALLGKIQGFDADFVAACGRLALLYAASYFMIRGISDLRERRLQVAALSAEKTVRIEEFERLAVELDHRRHELAEANLRTQEANRAKSQFLANMSHELRTPLNSIIGFSEILTTKLDGQIDPRFLRFLSNILGSGRHLLGLINDILDLSKIEAGKMEMHFEPISLGDLVRGVESVMHGVAAKRDITLELELEPDLPPVVADAPRLKQILYNLVSNAIKFSADGRAISVRARRVFAARSPLATDSVALEVEDRGIGIRREDQRLIFEEFRQADGETTRNTGGTGLGLALVKRFVEMHGGTVEVESEPGRGSLFRVFLPIDASHSPRREGADPLSFGFPVEAAREALAPGDSPVVLVAEDDDTFFTSFAADLEDAGYRVLRAARGDEALEIARSAKPAAVILDLVLPVKDGWEVLKELKADSTTAEIPVLIVSVVAGHELGFALGADEYFVKPLDRRGFLDRLREIVPAESPARPRVLVVDDDPQVHDYLTLELEEAGYEVLSAANGADGLGLAARAMPAVIVLDLAMEGMDGFRVASELQALPDTARIPIVVFTSKELTESDRQRLVGKTSAVLSKAPDDRRRLPAVLRELESRRSHRMDRQRTDKQPIDQLRADGPSQESHARVGD